MADFDFQQYNPALTRGTSNTLRDADYFFKKLQKKSKELADDIVAKRAETMYQVLRFRFPLGKYQGKDLGRYPRSDLGPTKFTPERKHSYSNWSVTPKGSGRITIQNSTTGSGGFSYPLLLLNGEKGSYHWNFPIPSDKVNSAGFSTQMPYGIQFFILRHRDLLKSELKEAFKNIMKEK